MAAFGYLQLRTVVHLRLRIVQCVCCFGQCGGDVEGGNCPRGFQDARSFRGDALPQGLEQRLLHFEQPLVRAERLFFVLLERGCDVPLSGGDGLPALVVLWNGMEVRFGHLDVVAEYPIEADPEVGDARPLAFLALHGRNLLLGVAADGAQLVEGGVHAVADAAAVARQQRRVVDDGRLDRLAHISHVVELGDQALDERRTAVRELGAQVRNDGHRLPQRDQVARPGRAQGDARDQPFEVVHRLERFPQPGALQAAADQLLDRIEPVVNHLDRARRPLQPGAQQASAHRRRRAVDLGEQPAVAAAVGRVDDLQVPAGGGIDDHVVGARAVVDPPHVREVDLLGVPQVLHHGAGGRRGCRVARQLGTIEGGGPELVAQRFPRVLQSEHPGLERRDRQFEHREFGQQLEQRQIAGDNHLARPEH